MLLTQAELQSLVEVKQRTPHRVAGDAPAGRRHRAWWCGRCVPDAAKVEVQPVREKDKPAFKLTRLHKAGLFEGVTTEATRVYAYDLVITDQQGRVRRTRDPYSFLPTLGEADLFLFGKGDERRIYDKLGAQLRTIDGVRRHQLRRLGAQRPAGQRGGRFQRLGRALPPDAPAGRVGGVGDLHSRAWAKGRITSSRCATLHGKIGLKTDPYGFFFETAPKNAAIVWNNRKFEWTDEAWLTQRRQRDPLRAPLSIYEVHLGSWRKKSAGRIAGLPRAGRAADRNTSSRWASRTWSSCRWPSTPFTRRGATR